MPRVQMAKCHLVEPVEFVMELVPRRDGRRSTEYKVPSTSTNQGTTLLSTGAPLRSTGPVSGYNSPLSGNTRLKQMGVLKLVLSDQQVALEHPDSSSARSSTSTVLSTAVEAFSSSNLFPFQLAVVVATSYY